MDESAKRLLELEQELEIVQRENEILHEANSALSEENTELGEINQKLKAALRAVAKQQKEFALEIERAVDIIEGKGLH